MVQHVRKRIDSLLITSNIVLLSYDGSTALDAAIVDLSDQFLRRSVCGCVKPFDIGTSWRILPELRMALREKPPICLWAPSSYFVVASIHFFLAKLFKTIQRLHSSTQ